MAISICVLPTYGVWLCHWGHSLLYVHTHPIWSIASFLFEFPVHIDILFCFGLILTTAPHTSSLLSPNASPIKHINCRRKINHLTVVCVYVCVCVCVCVYVCIMCACVLRVVCVRVCYVCAYMCYACVCMCVFTVLHACTCVCAWLLCVCAYVHTHMQQYNN